MIPKLAVRNPELETRNPEPSSAAATLVAHLRAHRSPRDIEGQRHYPHLGILYL